MDNLLKRFLDKIGIKNIAPFESGYFSSIQNDKANNRIIGVIHLNEYLSYDVYQNFFDTISTFVAHGGFGIRLSFAYKNEESKMSSLLEEFKEKQNCTMLDDVDFIYEGKEKKLLFYYQSADGAAQIADETKKLKNF